MPNRDADQFEPDAGSSDDTHRLTGGDDATTLPTPPDPILNSRVGPYRLLERIGEGGMGEVYLAEQRTPIKRRVALKLIKVGMDTKEVIARFESERQALAMMDHPNVAKIFDAGSTDAGRPYFVMEHVRGVTITEYCDQHKLANRERLDLFTQVCDGVQHAHQKGVIHRDLKPSNVLVTIRDGQPVPKIIDFGVAKATAQTLTDLTVHTQLGVLIGTPAYMSPEQARLTGADVDTRTDVYALGVMLYELLVGALPFDPDELRRAGFEAMVKKICDEEPQKPSTRLATLGDRSTRCADRRRTELPALQRELSGDLDWITMKALEKDRTRRYSSPSDLAADIERYRADQPVLACPPTAAYRAGKFVRRHRSGVAAAVVGLMMLVALAVTMTVQAGRIATERDRANQEAAAKGQVAEFLKSLFTMSDPNEARGSTITARELLDKGAERIEGMLGEQPETRTELLNTMGTVYRKLGLHGQAEPLLEQALAERERALGHDHPRTLDSANSLAALYEYQGRYDEAEALLVETVENQRRVLGEDHEETLDSIGDLAWVYMGQVRFEQAEPLFLTAVENQRRVLGADHEETLRTARNLALLYERQGRYDESETLYLDTLEQQKRVLGEDHPATLSLVNALAILYDIQGRFDEAERLFLANIETEKRVLGDDHLHTLASVGNLAVLYKDHGQYDRAEPLLLENVETAKSVLGDEHPATLGFMGNLADLYQRQGRYDEAEPLFLATLASWERVLGKDHLDTGITVHNLGCLYRDQGRYVESQRYFERSQGIFVATLGPDHPAVAENLTQWAALLRESGDDAAAAELEARARAIQGE